MAERWNYFRRHSLFTWGMMAVIMPMILIMKANDHDQNDDVLMMLIIILLQEETLTVECTKKQCPPLTDCLHRYHRHHHHCHDCHHQYCHHNCFIVFSLFFSFFESNFFSEAVRVHPLDCCKVCPAQVSHIDIWQILRIL